ncbi:hypothetical protein AB0F88_39800 [Streptosporangium sp. NPDC023963]|uniref:hypothetical protein n=1 Tax=Streptosporangium sp. NPDC023963 TaxID=3155608 RepID=UPI00341F3651
MGKTQTPVQTPVQNLVAEAPERLVYSPAIVAMFRTAAEPELNKADIAIAEREAAIAKLQGEIAAWQEHAAGIRQALRDVETNSKPVPPIAPAKCGACGALIVYGDIGWVHAGRELKDGGHLCNPDRADSPMAKPAAPGELSADPEALIANFKAAHDEFNGAEGGRR